MRNSRLDATLNAHKLQNTVGFVAQYLVNLDGDSEGVKAREKRWKEWKICKFLLITYLIQINLENANFLFK